MDSCPPSRAPSNVNAFLSAAAQPFAARFPARTPRRVRYTSGVPSHLLLVDCPDQPGLVHKITGALFRSRFNIVRNHEFVDLASSRFFMRTEFTGEADREPVLEEVRELLPAGANVRLSELGPRSIVVLATKEHHCLAELLVRHAYSELGATIRAVVSNHTMLESLVGKFEIPFHHADHEDRTREEHEDLVGSIIDRYAPDWIVLAKYMRILSPQFVARYAGRIINIHHSFLPAFVGAEPYAQAFARGVKIIGATAHFVTEQLDDGPIIAQSVIPIDHTQSPREMAQAGRDIEKLVLARALTLVMEERVFLSGNKTVIFD
jgi:formyltetrahydrofolate deformylase